MSSSGPRSASPDDGWAGLVLGLDVGGSKISALLVDGVDRLVAARSIPTDGRPLGDQVLDAARDVLDGTLPAGVGIAVPGQVNTDTGVVRMAVNLSVPEVPLAAMVRQGLGVPAFVDHDTRAAAAWLLDRDGGSGSLAYLSVGTGISAAVVIDGRLLRGVNGFAGEIGHLLADPHGPPCACGLAGCLEAVAAGPAVARRAAEVVAGGAHTSLAADAVPADVFRAAANGDQEALGITHGVGAHLARAIRGIVLAYGVDRVVIGGGLSRAGDPFLRPILDELERERAASALVRRAITPGHVELLPPDTEAGAWGAVLIARSGLRVVPRQAGRQREVEDG